MHELHKLLIMMAVLTAISVGALVQAERQLAELAIEMQESRPYAVIGE